MLLKPHSVTDVTAKNNKLLGIRARARAKEQVIKFWLVSDCHISFTPKCRVCERICAHPQKQVAEFRN